MTRRFRLAAVFTLALLGAPLPLSGQPALAAVPSSPMALLAAQPGLAAAQPGLAAVPAGAAAAPELAAAQPPPPPQGGQPVTFGVRPATATGPDNRTRFTYGATPGAVVRDHIAVSNISEQPLNLRVYASDAFNTPEGGFDLLAAGRAPTDVGSWIRAERDTVEIPGRSVAIVPFVLTVPADATPGDHAGGVVASLATERTDAAGNKVAVEQRVGARVYLRIAGELRPQLSVEALTATYHHNFNPLGRGSMTVRYTVRNAGNVRLQGRQWVSARLPWGATVDAADLPALPELLPGSVFAVTAEVPNVLPAGWLTGTVRLEPGSMPGDDNPPLPGTSASTTTSAVPWTLLAFLLLITAFVLLRRWRRRRGVSTATPPPPAGEPVDAVTHV